MALGTVYWEDNPSRERLVTHVCHSCQRAHVKYGAEPITSLGDVWIVSPFGVAHIQRDTNNPITLCGVNAIGGDWWWRT